MLYVLLSWAFFICIWFQKLFRLLKPCIFVMDLDFSLSIDIMITIYEILVKNFMN